MKKTETAKQSKRIGVLLDGEQHENLSRICYMQRTTITAVIQELVAAFIKANKGDLKRYKKIFDKPTAADGETSAAEFEQAAADEQFAKDAENVVAGCDTPPEKAGDTRDEY